MILGGEPVFLKIIATASSCIRNHDPSGLHDGCIMCPYSERSTLLIDCGWARLAASAGGRATGLYRKRGRSERGAAFNSRGVQLVGVGLSESGDAGGRRHSRALQSQAAPWAHPAGAGELRVWDNLPNCPTITDQCNNQNLNRAASWKRRAFVPSGCELLLFSTPKFARSTSAIGVASGVVTVVARAS
jgi:hypothetical protein